MVKSTHTEFSVIVPVFNEALLIRPFLQQLRDRAPEAEIIVADGGSNDGTADISAGIKQNIDAESKQSNDAKFHVKHEGKDLALDLVKVHDDRLQDLGAGKYFACVDMKATDGKTYDIDFFLTGQPGKMKVTETSVHKIDGKPLYNWKEKNGKWQKVPAS